MNDTKKAGRYLILLAPIVFVSHFLEESPGFVAWFNLHVSRHISSQLFWSVNISALVITILVVLTEWTMSSAFSAWLCILWFSFLMFANAIFHIAGALVDRNYVPGLVTAIVLYLPYYFWLIHVIVKTRKLKISLVLCIGLLGSLPMLIHGYRILFLGSRLF